MVVAIKRFDLNKDQHNGFCVKVVSHPSTNPARPGLTSELVCLPSLFLAKIFSQTPPSPPSNFLLSLFSLYPRFASYCEYHISSIHLFEEKLLVSLNRSCSCSVFLVTWLS